MAAIELKNLGKSYDGGTSYVIEDMNLSFDEKDFVVILGPSGCGKSTTLRMIAGIEDITTGDLMMDGVRVNDIPSKNRDIAMVFQNYALFPHMNVYDNIAFALKIKKVDKQEIKRRVENAANLLGLDHLLKRKPGELSGGQQQRVALGRAMVNESKFFLMDEPLSNLDANLRTQMREEILSLHKRLETTTIFVTHDQVEAMTMASKIVVLNSGKVMQVGHPTEIYDNPANHFVAKFIGNPKMNFIEGMIHDNRLTIADKIELNISETKNNQQAVEVGIRPEHIVIGTKESHHISGHISFIEMLGSTINASVETEIGKIVFTIDRDHEVVENDHVYLTFMVDKMHVFDQEPGDKIALKVSDVHE